MGKRKSAQGAAATQDAAAPEKPAANRPIPWQVKAVALISAMKSSTATIKSPFVLLGLLSSVQVAAFFTGLLAVTPLVGSWILARLTARFPPSVTTWYQQLCGLVSNLISVIDPTSLMPIIPGAQVGTTFLAEALLGGCAEQLQATAEEYEAWGQWVRGAGSVTMLAAPMIAPLITSDMIPVFYYCLIVDVLISALLFVFAVPKEQAPPPPAMSWAEMLRLRTLRTAPGRWMTSWSLLQTLEHRTWELLIMNYVAVNCSPSAFQVSMLTLSPYLLPYTPPLSSFVQRCGSTAPRLLLLSVSLLLPLLRWGAFSTTSPWVEMVLVGVGTYVVGAMAHAKIILWTECVAEKDEAPATAAIQGVIDCLASVVAPCGLCVAAGFFRTEDLVIAGVLLSACVVLAGQAGPALLGLPAHGRAKEE